MATVYGIGNPLIDYLCSVTEKDLDELGLAKGTMLLINTEKRQKILNLTQGRDVKYSCGGSCPNTMVTLSNLGVETILAGSVGNDLLGRHYKERLAETGVVDNLVVKEGGVTGTSIILLTGDKERTMNTYLGANRLFGPSDLIEGSADKCDIFYFTGYMWDTETQKAAVRKTLEKCKAAGKKVAFDVADPFAVSRYHDEFKNLISEYCDIVFANKEEARSLMGLEDVKQCCIELGKLCPVVLVKNGKKGSYLSDHQVVSTIPVYGPVSPVDTTGAGDTYAAGFLFGYATGRDNITSCNIASYLAGEIISQVGAQFTKERITEICAYIDEHFRI